MESDDQPRLLTVLPNPVADGDVGEYLVVQVPRGVDGSTLTVDDGESTVRLPANRSGRVVLARAPNRSAIPDNVEGSVALRSDLRLANSGEQLRLRRGNTTVDTAEYTDAPEGEVLRLDGRGQRWQAVGATDFTVRVAGPGTVRAFVLPDAGGMPSGFLQNATERVRLAGYTLTSTGVRRALLAAHRRGVSVRVLVDGDPVGGMTPAQIRVLDGLADAGVDVRVTGGSGDRYAFHHPKYAVVDDRALVTTENWKPAGTGGRSSRGWGVVTRQERIVAGLTRTFGADFEGRGVRSWTGHRDDVSLANGSQSTRSFPSRVEPTTVPVRETRLLVAPDNAESALLGELRRAEESIRIVQASTGGRNQPFVRAALRAARGGVDVQLLLSSAWYAREDNAALVAWLRERASEEDLPLSAKLAEPGGRFEKIHAKGVVIDGERVVLGSLNWNNNSARENREVALVLSGERIASYYGAVFRADWGAGGWRVTLGTLVAALLAVAGGLWWLRRVDFAEQASQRGRRDRADPATDPTRRPRRIGSRRQRDRPPP